MGLRIRDEVERSWVKVRCDQEARREQGVKGEGCEKVWSFFGKGLQCLKFFLGGVRFKVCQLVVLSREGIDNYRFGL